MSARASGETVTESQSKDVRVATNHLVTITKRVIDGGRTGEILCLGVIKNSSGFTKQVSLSFEFYCNTGGGIEVR